MLGFHNILFKYTSSYDSTFMMYKGKFRWFHILMGITQLPGHLQYIVKSILHGDQSIHPFLVVIYLDDIAIHGDTQEQVLDNMLYAIKYLASDSFILSLWKSHLVYRKKNLGTTGLLVASGPPT